MTEGYKGTGYGHLTRCLSIYQAFEEKGIKPLYVANCDEEGKKFIPNVILLQMNWIEQTGKLIETITDFDIAVIDSYLAPKELLEWIYKVVNKVIYIDDFVRLDYPPGVVVNGTIGAENLPYKKDEKHRYLLGNDYIPLRREFWDVELHKRDGNVKNILITFGAQDIRNLSSKVLAFLHEQYPICDYYVVGGKLPTDELKKENVHYFDSLNAEKMLELMVNTDLAVSAAGQTTYELARIGLPTIIIGVAENQINNIIGWKFFGYIKEELWYDDEDLLDRIKTLVLDYSSATIRKSVIDGQGARRIVANI